MHAPDVVATLPGRCPPKLSAFEPRYPALGASDLGRQLMVVFTTRNQRIRFISARDQSRKERHVYESHQKADT